MSLIKVHFAYIPHTFATGNSSYMKSFVDIALFQNVENYLKF